MRCPLPTHTPLATLGRGDLQLALLTLPKMVLGVRSSCASSRRAWALCLIALIGAPTAAALRLPARQCRTSQPRLSLREKKEESQKESSINPYEVFGWLVLFSQLTPAFLTAAGRAGLWSPPPLNLFTDIANAAMEAGIADGSVPKWRATMYSQDVWKELLGQYYANGESTSFLTEAGGICAQHAEYCAGLTLP